MSRAAPRWTPAKTVRPAARRRQAPLALAMALAILVWGLIVMGGAVLSAWLA